MGFLIRAITFLLTAAVLIAWMLTAYSKAEGEPSLIHDTVPTDENVWQWGLRISTSMIYFMLTDLLAFIWNTLTKWHELTPERRFGSLLLILLLISNLLLSLKERNRRAIRTVYCEIDNTRALPISGSYNRYRCRKGHQFADDPHML